LRATRGTLLLGIAVDHRPRQPDPDRLDERAVDAVGLNGCVAEFPYSFSSVPIGTYEPEAEAQMKTVQITLPDELHQRLKDVAWSRRKTLADTFRAILDENLPPSATGGDKAEGAAR
jgi:hypothetical protein